MTDFRQTQQGRRQSWYGTKRYVKQGLSLRVPHSMMRQALRIAPKYQSSRLPAPAHIKEVTGRVDDTTFVMVRPDRCEIAKELYWGNGRRPDPCDDLAVRLFAAFARDVDVVLDVGAYTGLFSLVSARCNPAVQVHAFEVVPEVFKMLFDNCVRNDLLPQVTLHPAGIGRLGQTVRFPITTSEASLPSFYSAKLVFTEGATIPFVSLDSLVPDLPSGSRVAMKIDVEGTENEVFEHGREFFAAFTPDVLCEVLPGATTADALMQVLQPLGYRYYLVGDRGLLPRESIAPDANFRDWVFSTRSPDDVPFVRAD